MVVAQGTRRFYGNRGLDSFLSLRKYAGKENLSEFISSHINFALTGTAVIPIGVSPKKNRLQHENLM